MSELETKFSAVTLRVTDSTTYVIGRLTSDIYKEFKKTLGYKDPEATWRVTKQKDWDGYVSAVCYNEKWCKCSIKKDGVHFPTGLYSRAIDFFRAYCVPVTVSDERSSFESNKISIGITPSLEFRDYQSDIIEKAAKSQRGIIKVATGGGKTAIGSGIIAKIGVAPFIFYVTSQDLLRQAKSELERFLSINNSPMEVGVIGGGKCDIRDVNIMTIQTAVRALGEKFHKFDDEEEPEEISAEMKERYDTIANLVHSAKGMICDEVQHWAANTCQVIADHSYNARFRYGLSVSPDSFVELKGYPFGEGFHGSIESAWEIISETEDSFFDQEYEIINLEKLDIQSRGWNGKEFCWKKVKKFIRHIGPDQLYSVRYKGGQELQLTGDHSVFRVEQSDKYEVIHGKKKFYGKINEIETEKLNVGDILLQDNGNNWQGKDETIDALYCLSNFYSSPNKIRVRCNLSNISHEQLKLSTDQFRQICSRNPNGSSVNILQYLGMQQSVKDCPSVDFIYTEGAKGVGIHRFIPLADLAYLLGFYIGDGWFDGNRVNFAVEKTRVNNFLERISKLKWLVCNPVVREMNGESVEIRISNALFVCILKQALKIAKCYDKRLSPEWIMSWSKENRRKLLEGLIDSDGCRMSHKTNKTEARYTTTSFGLSQDVMSLIRSLGGRPSLSIRKPANGGIVDGRQIIGKRSSYQVIWSMSCLDGNNLGHFGSPQKFLYEESLHEVRVREIKRVPFSGYVYDFEMEGHPSFVANGILVHNSATPWRDMGDDLLIDACFGKMIAEINASFLIKKGILVKPTIYFVHTRKRFSDEEIPYATAYKEGIVQNEERNLMIANIAQNMVKQGRHVLILAKHIEHGNSLESMVPNSVFLNGSHGAKVRQKHIDQMRIKKAPITIATSIFDEGVDVKPLDGLVLAGSGKSQTRALQRIGRVIRSFEDPSTGFIKKDAYIVDFHDNMKYMLGHSKARRRIYETEPEFVIKDFKGS